MPIYSVNGRYSLTRILPCKRLENVKKAFALSSLTQAARMKFRTLVSSLRVDHYECCTDQHGGCPACVNLETRGVSTRRSYCVSKIAKFPFLKKYITALATLYDLVSRLAPPKGQHERTSRIEAGIPAYSAQASAGRWRLTCLRWIPPGRARQRPRAVAWRCPPGPAGARGAARGRSTGPPAGAAPPGP